MSKTIEKMISLIAKSNKKPRIVYAEGGNAFIQEAAKSVSKYIEPILVFKTRKEVPSNWNFKTYVIEDMDLSKYENLLFDLRKNKGMTIEEAKKLARQPNYLCPLLIKAKDADGEICGIDYTTKDTLKPALQIVKTDKSCKLVSSLFILEKGNDSIIFSDCAININPTSEDLAPMTEMACSFAKNIMEINKPKCGLLSYSTNGSGSGDSVDKVKKAVALLQANETNKQYDICGEMQFDAAYNDRVRAKKAKNCTWTSKPDVLMFPNIDAGNIGYKVAQQMGGYDAFGPILVGLAAPINDLSRGANVQDVIGLSYITAAQIVAQWNKH